MIFVKISILLKKYYVKQKFRQSGKSQQGVETKKNVISICKSS